MADRPGPLLRRVGRRARKRWRAWLRSVHRDVGYLVIGLTFVYAISGIAINHIDDFGGSDTPSKTTVTEVHQVDPSSIPRESPRAAAEAIASAVSAGGEPQRPFLADGQVDFTVGDHTFVADLETGEVTEEYQEGRFFLEVANWLHYNRGKEAWTFIADGYAVLLLFLATSGIFMLKGRKGFFGRGAVLIFLGVLVPILYVHYSGGPGG